MVLNLLWQNIALNSSKAQHQMFSTNIGNCKAWFDMLLDILILFLFI